MLGRYTAVSGEHIGHRLVRLPGPRGWLLITIIVLEVGAAPLVWAVIAKPCGDLVYFIFLQKHQQPDWLHPGITKNILTTCFVALALATSLRLSYSKLEKQQIAICCILVAGTLIGTLMVRPDIRQALSGSIRIGHRPEIPPWAPEVARKHYWLMLVTMVGYVGGSVMGYIVYAN